MPNTKNIEVFHGRNKGSSNKRYRENLKKYIPTNHDYEIMEKYFKIVDSEKFKEEFAKLLTGGFMHSNKLDELYYKFRMVGFDWALHQLSYKEKSKEDSARAFRNWLAFTQFDTYMYRQMYCPGPKLVKSSDSRADSIYSKPSFAYFENLFKMYKSKRNKGVSK